MDQQVRAVACLDEVTARACVAGEHDTATRVVEPIPDRAVVDVDHRERGDRHTVALVHDLGPVVRHLGGAHASSRLAGVAAQRLHVPRVRHLEMAGVGLGAEPLVFTGWSPDLHRITPTGLREAPQQGRHVADMIGVQMGQEDLRRRRHRQSEPVEVGQRARAEVEEEEVLLGIADLDEQRRRRLALLDERVPAAEDRHADLVGTQRLGAGFEHLGIRPDGGADDRCGRQRHRAAVVGQLGEFVDLTRHDSLRSIRPCRVRVA